MTGPRKPPHSARVLSQWVDAYAREQGLAPKRVRDWISYMILGGRLDQVGISANGPRFTIKGAVALEMRLPSRARATRDIDLVVDEAEGEDLAAVLRKALAIDYQDFTFRMKGEPYVMPNDAVRVEVAMDFRGRSWSTVQVDLSRGEGGATEVELVDALELEPFGLTTPSALPCLSLRYHIAQKIHAMTQPSGEGDTSNERFRDLADVLLLRELVDDLAAVRAACVEVFTLRGTHGWPPVLDPPAFWKELYAHLADTSRRAARTFAPAQFQLPPVPQHFLNFLPLPQGQGSLHPPGSRGRLRALRSLLGFQDGLDPGLSPGCAGSLGFHSG